MTPARFPRLHALALGAVFGLLFGPGWEFLTFYERLPLPWAQASWAGALVLAGVAARFAVPRSRWPAAALALLVPANFAMIGAAAPLAASLHALVGGAAIVLLSACARAQTAAALRWQLVGAATAALLHPPLALALGGANGWWMAALVFAVPAAAALALGNAVAAKADDAADAGLPDLPVLATIALLVFALPAYFDLVLGSAGGAQLGTVALATGLLLGTAGINRRWASRQAWLGLAFPALIVLPWGTTGWAWAALFVGGVGSAPALVRGLQNKPGRAALALACGAAVAAALCGAILSADAAGGGARWALVLACGMLPALALLLRVRA